MLWWCLWGEVAAMQSPNAAVSSRCFASLSPGSVYPLGNICTTVAVLMCVCAQCLKWWLPQFHNFLKQEYHCMWNAWISRGKQEKTEVLCFATTSIYVRKMLESWGTCQCPSSSTCCITPRGNPGSHVVHLLLLYFCLPMGLVVVVPILSATSLHPYLICFLCFLCFFQMMKWLLYPLAFL